VADRANVFQPKASGEILGTFYTVQAVGAWNRLPPEIWQIPTTKSFKNFLRQHMATMLTA